MFEKNKIIRDMTVDLQKRKDEVGKVRSEKEQVMKKLTAEKSLSSRYKMDLDQAHSILKGAEREIEDNKKVLDMNRKAFYKLHKERDTAFKNNATLEEINKKLSIEMHIMEQSNRKMEVSLEESAANINELGRQIKQLENERDRCLMEAQELTNKVLIHKSYFFKCAYTVQ